MPRLALKKIIQANPELAKDGQRLKSMLADECPKSEDKRYVNAIQMAQANVVAQMIGSQGSESADILLPRLTHVLVDSTGLQDDLAAWAVSAWAEALGIATNWQPPTTPPTGATKTKQPAPQPPPPTPAVNPEIGKLMKRGYMALEDAYLVVKDKDGEPYSEAERHCRDAHGFFNKVLDIDPEYAPAYVGKLCASIQKYGWRKKNSLFAYVIQKEEDLAHYYKPLDNESDYQKAIRFADATYRAKLEGYNRTIKERIADLKKKYALYVIIESTNTFFERQGQSRQQTSKYICEIRKSTSLVGNLKRGMKFKMLSTGRRYEVGQHMNEYGSWVDGVLQFDNRGDSLSNQVYICAGDVAVVTHEMVKQEEQERIERERQYRKEQERKKLEEQRKREEDQRKREEEQRAKEEQSRRWVAAGLCPHDGGCYSFWGGKCKTCGKAKG